MVYTDAFRGIAAGEAIMSQKATTRARMSPKLRQLLDHQRGLTKKLKIAQQTIAELKAQLTRADTVTQQYKQQLAATADERDRLRKTLKELDGKRIERITKLFHTIAVQLSANEPVHSLRFEGLFDDLNWLDCTAEEVKKFNG